MSRVLDGETLTKQFPMDVRYQSQRVVYPIPASGVYLEQVYTLRVRHVRIIRGLSGKGIQNTSEKKKKREGKRSPQNKNSLGPESNRRHFGNN
jgi:hypothetical protein